MGRPRALLGKGDRLRKERRHTQQCEWVRNRRKAAVASTSTASSASDSLAKEHITRLESCRREQNQRCKGRRRANATDDDRATEAKRKREARLALRRLHSTPTEQFPGASSERVCGEPVWHHVRRVRPTLGRQKLARLNAREFASLIIDILSEAKRRHLGSQHCGPSSLSDDEPLYDSVASDEENSQSFQGECCPCSVQTAQLWEQLSQLERSQATLRHEVEALRAGHRSPARAAAPRAPPPPAPSPTPGPDAVWAVVPCKRRLRQLLGAPAGKVGGPQGQLASTLPCATPDNGASGTRGGKDGKEVVRKGEEKQRERREMNDDAASYNAASPNEPPPQPFVLSISPPRSSDATPTSFFSVCKMKPKLAKKRQALSLKTKQSIAKGAESGMKNSSVAAKYNVADTTVSTVWKDREQVRKQLQQDSAGPMLQAKARSFGHLFEHEGFNPLNRWIRRFKDRHGISCKVISGESGEVDDISIQAGAIDMITASWWQVKAATIQKCFRNAGFVREALDLEDADRRSDAIDEAIGTDDMWSNLVENHSVPANDTFQNYVEEDDDDSVMREEATADQAIVAAVRGSGASPPEDELDGDEESTPEVSSKDALEFLQKLKVHCEQNPPDEVLANSDPVNAEAGNENDESGDDSTKKSVSAGTALAVAETFRDYFAGAERVGLGQNLFPPALRRNRAGDREDVPYAVRTVAN
ncbi:hypothetical protein HPB47_016142 [Ixodes persulcatus]|uniref:Uncharacterized protein n=1 Tax=Ixodes persulcatus TaxID=34615 RepID=A0AC60QSV5_IXOPE|nr:hypothetical protein HPB47_016142 [Ixodes persulcatus]